MMKMISWMKNFEYLYKKFKKNEKNYSAKVIEDFKCVDYTLIRSAISSADRNF